MTATATEHLDELSSTSRTSLSSRCWSTASEQLRTRSSPRRPPRRRHPAEEARRPAASGCAPRRRSRSASTTPAPSRRSSPTRTSRSRAGSPPATRRRAARAPATRSSSSASRWAPRRGSRRTTTRATRRRSTRRSPCRRATPRWASASSTASARQRRRDDHLELDRGRPDGDLPRHRVERRVRLQRELDDGDADRPDAAALQRDRPVGDDRQQANIDTALARTDPMMNYFAERYGPYPFDSNGAVAERSTGVGYALEVQGKSHYAGNEQRPGRVGHARARDRAPVVRQQRHARRLERDLVQRGLGAVVDDAWNFDVGSGTTSTAQPFADNYAPARTRSGPSRRPSSTATRRTCSRRSRPTRAGR